MSTKNQKNQKYKSSQKLIREKQLTALSLEEWRKCWTSEDEVLSHQSLKTAIKFTIDSTSRFSLLDIWFTENLSYEAFCHALEEVVEKDYSREIREQEDYLFDRFYLETNEFYDFDRTIIFACVLRFFCIENRYKFLQLLSNCDGLQVRGVFLIAQNLLKAAGILEDELCLKKAKCYLRKEVVIDLSISFEDLINPNDLISEDWLCILTDFLSELVQEYGRRLGGVADALYRLSQKTIINPSECIKVLGSPAYDAAIKAYVKRYDSSCETICMEGVDPIFLLKVAKNLSKYRTVLDNLFVQLAKELDYSKLNERIDELLAELDFFIINGFGEETKEIIEKVLLSINEKYTLSTIEKWLFGAGDGTKRLCRTYLRHANIKNVDDFVLAMKLVYFLARDSEEQIIALNNINDMLNSGDIATTHWIAAVKQLSSLEHCGLPQKATLQLVQKISIKEMKAELVPHIKRLFDLADLPLSFLPEGFDELEEKAKEISDEQKKNDELKKLFGLNS